MNRSADPPHRSLEVTIAPGGLGAPPEAEDIVGDYRSVGLTLGRHPLEPLRPQLLAKRLMPASTLQTYPNGNLCAGRVHVKFEGVEELTGGVEETHSVTTGYEGHVYQPSASASP
jgi:hypothetical protein